MKLSNSQLEIARTRPQRTKLDLFIFQPQPVLKCRVNNSSSAKGNRIIMYDTVTLGSYTDVESGMTMLVGTADGLEDVGRIRVKSASASQIIVSENDNINWVDNLYLTVLKYWEVWPIHPRIITNPNNNEDVIFYKDYDDPHIQQNNRYGSFINMGCHTPVLLEGGQAQVYYSASGTSNLRGQNLSYLWTFEGGTPSSSTAHTPGLVTYDTAGDYVTKLRVTASSGAQDSSYRYIPVRDRIGEGNYTPIAKWEMGDLSGGRSEAGYTVEFVLHELVDLFDGAVVMLRSENKFGDQEIDLGGNSIQRSDVFFCGYIDRGSIEYNYKTSQVRFSASTIHNRIKQATSFSISVESVPNASLWYELRDMNIQRAIYHYLRYHSTVLQIVDFKFNGTDYPIQFFDADRGSLFDAVDSLMQSALVGSLSSDRQGNLFAEVHPKAYPNPTGTFAPLKIMDIGTRDWMNTPKVEERLYDELSYMEAGGVAYSGSTGTYKALLSEAPGVPSFHGSVDKISGLALGSQSHLNTLVGHLWANKNARYPSIQMDGAISFTHLDIAPYEVVQITIPADDTVRGEEISGLYIPTQISWKYNPEQESLLPSITFESLVNGTPGRTIIIPPPEELEFPPFPPLPHLPPLPPLPPIIIPIEPEFVDNVQILVKNHGIFYTNDYSNADPTWYPMDTGITGSGVISLETTATGKMIAQYQENALYYAPNPGAPWIQIFDNTIDIQNVQSYPFPRSPSITGFGAIRNSDGDIILIGGLVVTIFSDYIIYSWVGNVADFPPLQQSAFLDVIFPSPGYLMYNGTEWIFSHKREGDGYTKSMTIDAEGLTIDNEITLNTSALSPTIATQSRFDTISAIVKLGDTFPNLPVITTDGGVTWTPVSGSFPYLNGTSTDDKFESIMAVNEGQWIVVGGESPNGFQFSLDGGAMWQTHGMVTGTITSVWHLGDQDFVLSGNNSIYGVRGFFYTGSSVTGSYVVDKTGNLRNWLTGSFSVFAIRHY